MKTINGNQFVASATEFFEEQPKRVNGHPTVSLLLFIHTPTSTYSWYPLTGESIADAVETGLIDDIEDLRKELTENFDAKGNSTWKLVGVHIFLAGHCGNRVTRCG